MSRANVDTFWTERILPVLDQFDAERASAIRDAWIRGPAAGLLGALIVSILIQSGNLLVLVLSALLPALVAASGPVSRLRALSRRIKQAVLSEIAQAFDYRFELDPGRDLRRLADELAPTVVLPPFTDIRIEDCFSGTRHGCRVEWFEAHLTDLAKREGWLTPFQGIILRIDLLRPVAGRTFVLPDGTISPETSWGELPELGSLKEISLAYPEFERKFQVIADDEVDARYMITPSFMEKLLELRAIAGLADMRATFLGRGRLGQFVMTLETPDHYELSSWNEPFPDKEDVQRVVHEISLVNAIVDVITEPASQSDDVKAMLARNAVDPAPAPD